MAKENRESVSFSEKVYVDITSLCSIMIPGDCNCIVRLSPKGVDLGA